MVLQRPSTGEYSARRPRPRTVDVLQRVEHCWVSTERSGFWQSLLCSRSSW